MPPFCECLGPYKSREVGPRVTTPGEVGPIVTTSRSETIIRRTLQSLGSRGYNCFRPRSGGSGTKKRYRGLSQNQNGHSQFPTKSHRNFILTNPVPIPRIVFFPWSGAPVVGGNKRDYLAGLSRSRRQAGPTMGIRRNPSQPERMGRQGEWKQRGSGEGDSGAPLLRMPRAI